MGAVLPRQVEAGQLRKGDFFEFKGKRCVVIKTSQQINNRKAFAIVEFRETEGGTKHKETIQAGDKVACCVREFDPAASRARSASRAGSVPGVPKGCSGWRRACILSGTTLSARGCAV